MSETAPTILLRQACDLAERLQQCRIRATTHEQHEQLKRLYLKAMIRIRRRYLASFQRTV